MTLMKMHHYPYTARVATIFRNLTIRETPLAPGSRIIGGDREWDKIDRGPRNDTIGGRDGIRR